MRAATTSPLRTRARQLRRNVGWLKERTVRRLVPARMRFAAYGWPLRPEVCPCDLHFCEYLEARNVRHKGIFHFGTGGHHLVGVRNHTAAWGNEIMGITASPAEHAIYVAQVVRDASFGGRYKVLFADVYNLSVACLPTFDVITLFHLGEFTEPASPRRRLDDWGLLDLFLSTAAPRARILFYASSLGFSAAAPAIERAVAESRMSFEEQYKSLRVYAVADRAV